MSFFVRFFLISMLFCGVFAAKMKFNMQEDCFNGITLEGLGDFDEKQLCTHVQECFHKFIDNYFNDAVKKGSLEVSFELGFLPTTHDVELTGKKGKKKKGNKWGKHMSKKKVKQDEVTMIIKKQKIEVKFVEESAGKWEIDKDAKYDEYRAIIPQAIQKAVGHKKNCTIIGVHLRRGDFTRIGKREFGHQPAREDLLIKGIEYFEKTT